MSKKSDSMVYGINIVWGISGGDEDWKRGGMHEKLLGYAKEIGATNTRLGICWCDVEKEKGTYDWSAIDERINMVHDGGLEIVGCVATTPEWATGLEKEAVDLVKERYPGFLNVLPCADEYLGDLARWCEAMAKRYKGKVKYYEIGNEDDGCPAPIIIRDYTGKAVDVEIGGDPAVYTRRLKTCYAAIKRVDPDAKVSTSGLAGGGHTMFLQQIYANGGGDSFDAVAIHPYKDFDEGLFWGWLEQTKELLDRMGDSHKKMWLTEWGYSVDNNDPEQLQIHAKCVEQVLLRMENIDYIEQASLHTLNDWRSNEGDPNSLQSMGLMTYDLKPKPAFEAYKRASSGQAELEEGYFDIPDRPEPMPPGGGEPVKCPLAALTPGFDGKLEDWANAVPIELVERKGANTLAGYCMWDKDYFYLAVRVEDDYYTQTLGGRPMWRGDSVQVAFDPERNVRNWPRYDYDDVEYGFCLTPNGEQGVRFHGGVNFPNGFVLGGGASVANGLFKLSVKQLDNAYLYEIGIPWVDISTKPVGRGATLGVSVVVNNYDREGSRTVYEFGSGIAAEKNPSLFRPLELAD